MYPAYRNPPLNTRGLISGFGGLDNAAFQDKPRAAILWKRGLRVIPLPHLSDGDMANVLWKTDDLGVIISSLYADQTKCIKDDLKKIEEVCKYAAQNGYGLILMGGCECSRNPLGKPKKR